MFLSSSIDLTQISCSGFFFCHASCLKAILDLRAVLYMRICIAMYATTPTLVFLLDTSTLCGGTSKEFCCESTRRLSARELLHHPAYQHIDVSRQRSSQILYTTTSKRARTRLNLRRGVLWCLRILGGIYYWTAVYIAYWTTLNTSSLLHRQASANPTATVSMVPGYVWEEQSVRYTRDNQWWPALVVTEGVV